MDYNYDSIVSLLRAHGNDMTIDSQGVNMTLRNALVDWSRVIGIGKVSFKGDNLYLNGQD